MKVCLQLASKTLPRHLDASAYCDYTTRQSQSPIGRDRRRLPFGVFPQLLSGVSWFQYRGFSEYLIIIISIPTDDLN